MSEYIKASRLAVSAAGHDKGTVYVVLQEEDDRVLVADGRLKVLAKPKAKNPKHLQMIIHLDGQLLKQMEQIKDDADLRRILRQYRMSSLKSTQEVMHVKD